MKRALICRAVVGGVLWSTLMAGRAYGAGTLLVNGSFEEGGAATPLNPGSTSIAGWTVTRGQIDWCEVKPDFWTPTDGTRSVDLNGSPGVGGIEQTFATVPGQVYEVQFDQAANTYDADRISNLGVTAAGQSAQFAFDCTGYSIANMGWVRRDWQFTATDATTTLEFYSLDASTPLAGPVLDNVTVLEAVPEPASLGVLGLGVVGLLLRRRRG